MATITIRNLNDDIVSALKQRAATHGASMEAEARAILTSAVRPVTAVSALLDAFDDVPDDFPDLEIPARTDLGRVVDFS